MKNLSERIEEMLELQNSLNNETNGKYWPLQKTSKNKVINWKRCIYMELAELIDSYPWKHWKNIDSNPDTNNIKIELVDIWHFILSELLRTNNVISSVKLIMLFKDHPLFKNNQPTSENSPQAEFKKALLDLDKNENEDKAYSFENSQVEVFENMINISTSTIPEVKTKFNFEILNLFFRACVQEKLSFEELFQLYIGKNILNSFRQDNGYKEGSYIKEWNGEEDNVVMLRGIKELGTDFTSSKLKEFLTEQYPGN